MDEEVLNHYCWMYSTFDIPEDFMVSQSAQIQKETVIQICIYTNTNAGYSPHLTFQKISWRVKGEKKRNATKKTWNENFTPMIIRLLSQWPFVSESELFSLSPLIWMPADVHGELKNTI